jgi:hypothetical protein
MSQPVGFVRDLIEHGLQLLGAGLNQYPEFNPDGKYAEKNHYFAVANNLGLGFLQTPGLEWVAEMYFQVMLDNILRYEEQSGKKVNKGMVYANLGISQIRNGKLDEGIADFFAAEYEDRQYEGLEDWDILDTTLWWQFESLVVNSVFSFVGEDVISEFHMDENSWKRLFKEMGRQDRIFFDGTVLVLWRNWEIFQTSEERQVEQNAYTLGQLYSGLRDLCLSIESLLRHKQGIKGPCNLDSLLRNAGYSREDKGKPSINDLEKFMASLDQVIREVDDLHLRRIYCLQIYRNFTVHRFEMTEKAFFERYSSILTDVFGAILYLKSVGAI